MDTVRPTLEEHVNKQAHYSRYKIEPIDFVVANNLPYREGNIIKYVCRWPYKGQALSDLYKAKDYLERIIKDVEAAEASNPAFIYKMGGVDLKPAALRGAKPGPVFIKE